MKTKLKVGDSFEVVRPLSECGYASAFDTNRTTIINPKNGRVICNSNYYRSKYCEDKNGMFNSINSLPMPITEVKRIGKLTITKLK